LGIGDWGLGIGDWANPQSPIILQSFHLIKTNLIYYKIIKNNKFNNF